MQQFGPADRGTSMILIRIFGPDINFTVLKFKVSTFPGARSPFREQDGYRGTHVESHLKVN